MSLNNARIWLTAPPLLAAIAPLAGCDENATTAPEEPPPPRESVVEEAAPSPDPEIIWFQTEGPIVSGIMVLHGGSVYTFESFQSLLAGELDPDLETRDDLDVLAEILNPPTHETTTWSDFELCDECEIELTEVVRFGEPESPGVIGSIAPRVSWNEQLGYVVVGSTSLQIFDDDGRFVRRIGGEGEGPGEFSRVIDAHVVDGRLVALDYAQSAWSIFNLAGEFIQRRPYGHSTGPFVPVGGSHVVVVNMDESPELAGLPLHLADIDSGVPTLHFGSGDDAWESRPYSNNVQGSVTSRPGTVWWGATGSPRVQEWSVDDELLRVVDGELPWFPEVTEFIDPTREPPSTLLRSLALDGRERLWMTVRTADPEWQEVELERTQQGHRAPPERRGDYMDTRLDIFDLEEQRHIGRYVWDSPYARLINLGGEPAVSIVEYTEDNGLQVVIYRVGWGARDRPDRQPFR